jgi:hypothetical protein
MLRERRTFITFGPEQGGDDRGDGDDDEPFVLRHNEQRSMTGAAPTNSHFTRSLDAVPVH